MNELTSLRKMSKVSQLDVSVSCLERGPCHGCKVTGMVHDKSS